jgi:hypothetical protein
MSAAAEKTRKKEECRAVEMVDGIAPIAFAKIKKTELRMDLFVGW